jgi:hypothetical protein
MKNYFFSYCFSAGYGNGIALFPKVTPKNFEKFVEHIKYTVNDNNIVVLYFQEIK